MLHNPSKKFSFYINWLIVANVIALFVGLLLVLFPESFFLKPHNNQTLSTFFEGNEVLYQKYKPLKNWLFAIIGATIIGFHLLAIFIINFALRQKEKWAYFALWVALIAWFLIDSSWSLFYGAAYNVWFINLPAFVMIAIPLILLNKAIMKT